MQVGVDASAVPENGDPLCEHQMTIDGCLEVTRFLKIEHISRKKMMARAAQVPHWQDNLDQDLDKPREHVSCFK